MKRFYLLLGLVAVVGAVLIWQASRPSTGGAPATDDAAPVPVTAADSAFRGYVLGSDSAPVEIVEYADYECPVCAQFGAVQFPDIRQQLIETGRVHWRFRDFPLVNIHRWSRLSALVVACASEQGKTWEAMDALFQRHGEWAQRPSDPTGLFADRMRGIGLDMNGYRACMDGKRYAGRVEASRQEGLARNVGGTPTFFVNGREYNFRRATSDEFLALVDSLTRVRR
ncbi:MAG TPA: thioredoxin domain-containing protein [Gemmatimonadales bacterium]|nr:thioredoxin domain-containing protein [Gemmatimonadales bacterium]